MIRHEDYALVAMERLIEKYGAADESASGWIARRAFAIADAMMTEQQKRVPPETQQHWRGVLP